MKYLNTSSAMSNVTGKGECHLEVAVAPPSCGSSPPTSLLMRPPSGRCEVWLLRPVSCWSPDGRHAVGRFLSTLWTSKVHSGVIHHYRRHTVSISSAATHVGLFVFFVLEQEPCRRGRWLTQTEKLLSPSGYLRASSCGLLGRDWCLHGLHSKVTCTHCFGLNARHIPKASRPLSNEISPRCGSSKYADRAQRDERRCEVSSRPCGAFVDPSGPTSSSKAASSPSSQDVDCAHWTLATPGLFTAFDARTSEHWGTSCFLKHTALFPFRDGEFYDAEVRWRIEREMRICCAVAVQKKTNHSLNSLLDGKCLWPHH